MMYLSDMLDLVRGLSLVENGHLYMGKLDAKKELSIGVYNSKHEHAFKTAIGGPALESYGTKYVSLLVHGNRSPRDTERLAVELFEALRGVREKKVNQTTIKFIQLLTGGPVDAGTDEAGIYEMVIEAAVIYAKGE